MNIIVRTEYGREPAYHWHRAEWVAIEPGVRKIRYETDFDVTILLRNIAVAGGLTKAYIDGRVDGIKDGEFLHGVAVAMGDTP